MSLHSLLAGSELTGGGVLYAILSSLYSTLDGGICVGGELSIAHNFTLSFFR